MLKYQKSSTEKTNVFSDIVSCIRSEIYEKLKISYVYNYSNQWAWD